MLIETIKFLMYMRNQMPVPFDEAAQVDSFSSMFIRSFACGLPGCLSVLQDPAPKKKLLKVTPASKPVLPSPQSAQPLSCPEQGLPLGWRADGRGCEDAVCVPSSRFGA